MLDLRSDSFSFSFDLIRSGCLRPYALLYPDQCAKARRVEPKKAFSVDGESTDDHFFGPLRLTTFSGGDEDFRLTWEVGEASLGDVRTVLFRVALTNLTDRAVYLKELGLSSARDEALVCAGAPGDWFLGGTATLAEKTKSAYERLVERYTAWELTIPPAPADEESRDGRYRHFSEFLTLCSQKEANGLLVAPVGEPAAFLSETCFVDHDPPRVGAVRLEIRSEMSNVLLQPGETRWGQQTAFVYGPYEKTGDAVMRHLADTHGSRIKKPPVTGWCSWYDRYSDITEESVLSSAVALAGLKNRRPVDVIQIDDGYQTCNGDWDCNEKFPNGFAPFLQAAEDAGAMPGIWLAPTSVHSKSRVVQAHPDWIARLPDGTPNGTCENWGPTAYWLDLTRPEAFQFAVDTLRSKRALGFAYFKIDFNTVIADGRFSYDASRTSLQLYRDLYAAYREAIGEDAWLCSCSGLTRGTFGYADSSRIGPDSPPIWDRLPDESCLRGCLNAVAGTCMTNGVIYANDPDVTFLFPKRFGEYPVLTPEELQTWHTAVGLLGGTQMISDPMAEDAARQSLRMLEILSPPAKEKAKPLHPATDPLLCRFAMSAERPFGDSFVEMVHNPSDAEESVAVALPVFGGAVCPCHVWSFWDRRYLGAILKSASRRTDAYCCGFRLFRKKSRSRSSVQTFISPWAQPRSRALSSEKTLLRSIWFPPPARGTGRCILSVRSSLPP